MVYDGLFYITKNENGILANWTDTRTYHHPKIIHPVTFRVDNPETKEQKIVPEYVSFPNLVTSLSKMPRQCYRGRIEVRYDEAASSPITSDEREAISSLIGVLSAEAEMIGDRQRLVEERPRV